MRLIELTSTRTSFKTVRFNRTGLSLIVGRHTKSQAKNIQSTYNGVGKSLLVALLHFCLGSNKNKHFDARLSGWDFTLTFEHNGKQYRSTRSIGENKIQFDGNTLSLAAYKNELNALGVFEIPDDGGGLTFRALINFFLRPTRGSYLSPDGAVAQWTPYDRVLYQSFLLGLDFHRAAEKHGDKKKFDEIRELARKYGNDKDLQKFFLGEKNPEMELASLAERIVKLNADLAAFQVAKDYSEREGEANAVRARLNEARNEVAILAARLANIESAKNVRPDVTPERIEKLYAESEVILPSLVVKRLEEVDAFNTRLRENRLKRLDRESKIAEAEARKWQSVRADLERELDGLFQYLSAHRAIDEFTENNRFLAELTARRHKIEDYLSLQEKFTAESQRIRAQMTNATVETTEYLTKMKPHLDRLMETYRFFAREFYGDKPAGLVVRNNDGENQLRYDIEARIEHDQADGINDVRIFCFDLLLLTLRQRHQVEFLLHDSRLFDGIDPHQRWTLFRLADRVCRENNWQYIATINEDAVESMREPTRADFNRLFVDSRVLELTDEPNGAGKLLGIQVEMKYEDE